jgi:hypothetical protein
MLIEYAKNIHCITIVKYIIMHFTLCFFVDLDNFGHEKEEAEEQMEEEKADAAVEDVTLEDVLPFQSGMGVECNFLIIKIILRKCTIRYRECLCKA